MNITDIDDKIIKRARQNHLYNRYVAAGYEIEKSLSDTKHVLDTFSKKVNGKTNVMELTHLSDWILAVSSALNVNFHKKQKTLRPIKKSRPILIPTVVSEEHCLLSRILYRGQSGLSEYFQPNRVELCHDST